MDRISRVKKTNQLLSLIANRGVFTFRNFNASAYFYCYNDGEKISFYDPESYDTGSVDFTGNKADLSHYKDERKENLILALGEFIFSGTPLPKKCFTETKFLGGYSLTDIEEIYKLAKSLDMVEGGFKSSYTISISEKLKIKHYFVNDFHVFNLKLGSATNTACISVINKYPFRIDTLAEILEDMKETEKDWLESASTKQDMLIALERKVSDLEAEIRQVKENIKCLKK